ncbi:hypothetical protein [Nesterenkonia sp. CF4.4]|uniref:hypothetical protein n=1 Tax=Nesterenkonia sp. CF4.4 TaxID=3373079 RepID=UPI003EE4AB2E
MKNWQLAWQMMTSMQKTVFIMLIVCAVCVLVLPETPYLVRMAGLGAFGAWLVIRPRRNRALHLPKASSSDRPQAQPRMLTEAERNTRLRVAAWHNGRRMVVGQSDRAGALKQMSDTIPDLPLERYELALDEALTRIHGHRAEVWARRAALVAQAHEMDALNAVFALHYYNRRYSGHIGEYGLGQIDLVDALGSRFLRGQIDEEVRRSDALIEEGIRRGAGSWDKEPNMAALRRDFPGFEDRALNDALDWGHVTHR